MKNKIIIFIVSLLLCAGIIGISYAGRTASGPFNQDGNNWVFIDALFELGASGNRIAKIWATAVDTTNIKIGGVSSGDLDMDSNIITNIGNANSDFEANGGISMSGRIFITGRQDETQLTAKGYSTQTNDIILFEQSGGTDLFTLDNSGDVYIAGKLGIATTTPAVAAHIISTSEQLRLGEDTTTYSQFRTIDTGDLRITSTGGDIRIMNDNLWVCTGGSIDSSGCPSVTLTGQGNLVVEGTIYEGTIALGACGGIQEVYDVDGNRYGTVIIGSQCWMTENMRTTKYPNGDDITKGCVTDTGCGGTGADKWGDDTTLYSCPPNTDSDAEDCNAAYRYGENATSTVTGTTGTGEALGLFYQWSAAMNSTTTAGAQGICPEGWHIPTDSELYTLENYLATGTCTTDRTGWGECDPAGDKMKTPDKCESLGGSNCGISGFNGLLSGYRNTNGGYYIRSNYTYLWSSTQSSSSNAWIRYLYYTHADVYRYYDNKANGFSVRCIKD